MKRGNRIAETFRRLKKDKRKALVTFVTAGDPSLAATEKFVLALERGGADVIELGVPFSDPMADGPVIQKASERALKKGVTLTRVLSLVRDIRRYTRVPIVLMGYYNPILAFGPARYAKEAARSGVDATIVVDLPPEESAPLDQELKKNGIDLIYLLTPTSDEARIRKVASRARGFIYFVSITGITGARLKSEDEVRRKVQEIRRYTKLPVAIGFGITTPDQAKVMSKAADGIVVGSALVKLIEKNASLGKAASKVERFVHALNAALVR